MKKNRKRIDPRYFLEETAIRDDLDDTLAPLQEASGRAIAKKFSRKLVKAFTYAVETGDESPWGRLLGELGRAEDGAGSGSQPARHWRNLNMNGQQLGDLYGQLSDVISDVVMADVEGKLPTDAAAAEGLQGTLMDYVGSQIVNGRAHTGLNLPDWAQ